MKKMWLWILLSVAGLVLIAAPISCMVGVIKLKMAERLLMEPRVYEPIAHTLAVCCQNLTSTSPVAIDHLVPEQVREAEGYRNAYATRTLAEVNFGGGFYGFGYFLVLDENGSNPSTNV